MISNNRSNYASSSEWLASFKQDYMWQSQLQQLQNATPDERNRHYQIAVKAVEEGAPGAIWYFCQHRVEKVVEELWESNELSMTNLKIYTVWMLTVEWLDQRARTAEVPVKLQSAEALLMWERLREGGFIVACGYALAEGVSNNQAAYIADCMADKLHINNKWKMFGQLWGIKNMAQLAGTWKETGKTPARADEIRALLN